MSTNVLPRPEGSRYLHYWRLVYADGSIHDESFEGRSIVNAKPHPIDLYVMKQGTSTPLWRIPIPRGAFPIWYRVRSMDVRTTKGNGNVKKSGISLDATVFGYVEENGSKRDGKLWMLHGDQTVNVPQQYFDPVAIDNCIRRGR